MGLFDDFVPLSSAPFLKKDFFDSFNGWLYRKKRALAGKTTRRRIRRWGRFPASAAECPHLSGARGVGWLFTKRHIYLAKDQFAKSLIGRNSTTPIS